MVAIICTAPGLIEVIELAGFSPNFYLAAGALFGRETMARSVVEDREYFKKRAEEELIKAAQAQGHVSAHAHLRMADEYRRRADELRPY